MRSDAGDVTQQLHPSFSLQNEQNRSTLKQILHSVELLGRLGLLLRGHRDSGALSRPGNTTEAGSQIICTEGNIHSLLQFMVTCNHHIMNTA